jgi:hypothetical protein
MCVIAIQLGPIPLSCCLDYIHNGVEVVIAKN